ncbi:hypothetical protein DFQ28_011510 [Apophysomyces sp. BC1034]|nr:hypothetical protein DFQ30_011358 [Apophysomyces sp. BC1015]KAG0167844.1 hypothetical protein DFQ29_000241 [Apophysomyces sp. BC1021]KAG0184258.1 hypothetical protein DFQ28_011510 [Apophysomyces sp. BC1034]
MWIGRVLLQDTPMKKGSKTNGQAPKTDSNNDVAIVKERGSYFTKNDKKLARLINMLQEFEHMSIREGARKVGLPLSTAIRRVKQFNETTDETNDGIITKEHKGRKIKPHNEHTLFIFEQLAAEPTITQPYAKPMSPYKRVLPQYFACHSEETIQKRRDVVAS